MSVILKAENISKQYRLGSVGTGSLRHDLNRWWHQVRGKEDPYLKIGSVNDRSAKATEDYVWALRDINFEVKHGEVLGIIGKNGAGKSTLLKILSRVTAPTTGSIKTKGRIASLLEIGTGFHPELTGRENIFMNGAVLGMTRQEIKAKLDEIIAFSGCEMYIDTPVKRYSSGMTVRLGFAVAAHLEPEILVIDEVLAVGDAEFQKKAIGKMQDLSTGEGRTVLFVSHNMASIQNLCTKALVLENGKEKLSGDVERCIREYLMLKDSSATYSSIELKKERKGGTEFRFTDLKFEDHLGNQLIVPQTGMRLKIKICFKSIIEINRVEFRLQFQDSHGYLVSTLNNYHSDNLYKITVGRGEVECVIQKLPLISGGYRLNLRAVDFTTKEILDEVNDCKSVNIESGDFYSTGKLPTVKQGILLEHYWNHIG